MVFSQTSLSGVRAGFMPPQFKNRKCTEWRGAPPNFYQILPHPLLLPPLFFSSITDIFCSIAVLLINSKRNSLPTISVPETSERVISARMFHHGNISAYAQFGPVDVLDDGFFYVGKFRHGNFQHEEFLAHGHFGTGYFST